MSLRTHGTDWVPKLLLGLMPVPVQTMISMLPDQVEGSVLTALVRVWWDYNGNTVFFSHHLTAKLVRKMVKGVRALDSGGSGPTSGSEPALENALEPALEIVPESATD